MEDDVRRLAKYLEGTCNTICMACGLLDLDEGEDWDDKLLDLNIEQCQMCGWWMESCHLEEDSTGKYVCEQCFEDEGED